MADTDYKKTLNLPETGFPMRGDLVKREPARIQHWIDMDLYGKIQRKNAGCPKFILHDGPPFTNGDVHIGTALNKILKDIILRYKSMRGFSTPYIPGWDCHGLPIEHKVAKMLREEKRVLPVADLRAECAKFSAAFIEKQTKQFLRLGVLADWKNQYKTMSHAYEAEILRTFSAFIKKGLVYRSKKPVYWSIPCATALAEAEIEYKDHVSPSIWVAFKLDEAANKALSLSGAEIVIWTTTPWTLPANLGITVHPEVEYAAVSANGRTFVVALPLAEKFAADLGFENPEIKPLCKGEALKGLNARHPFIERNAPIACARYVTMDSGTGCVHTAPGHGLEDYQTGLENGWEIYCPLDDDGRYVDDGRVPRELVGVSVLEEKGKNLANIKVLQIIEANGSLLKLSKIEHQYPHCWRSKTPVIFRAMDQWFVSLDKNGFRKSALEAISKVSWLPASGENRIRGAVESRPDWCISRQRVWGVPIPAFYDASGKAYLDGGVVSAIADKVERLGTAFWYTSSESEILDGIELPAGWPKASELKKGADTLDVWIDSGSSHRAVLAKNPDLQVPADLYFEGSDQHRGWFQSSLWTGVATIGGAPYKKVITHGFIVDEQRKKISKSDGKPHTADMYVNKWGADIVRLWISSEDYQSDIPVSDGIFTHVANTYRSVRNTIMYQLGNLSDFDFGADSVKIEELDAIDKWALHKACIFAKEAQAAYENYEFHKVYRLIDVFCGVTLSRIYHDILKDRMYTFAANSKLRRSSQTAIWLINDILLKVAAPILTFTCDEAYNFKTKKSEYSEDSIHLQGWCDIPENWMDAALSEKFDRLLKFRDMANEELEKLRQEKVIGKNLEAEVEIMVSSEGSDIAALREFEGKLAELFIVSSVKIVEGKFETPSIEARKAEGRKCVRCWRVVKDLDGDGLCPRCRAALEEIENS
ncbi:MAG: isoleucine--tRNA ligase [Opitutales bacterium]|nr:isoleucine--tRNA ligase [Opitutales bacterium]